MRLYHCEYRIFIFPSIFLNSSTCTFIWLLKFGENITSNFFYRISRKFRFTEVTFFRDSKRNIYWSKPHWVPFLCADFLCCSVSVPSAPVSCKCFDMLFITSLLPYGESETWYWSSTKGRIERESQRNVCTLYE